MKTYQLIIGNLLMAANTKPPSLALERFYAMKDRILSRYGRVVSHDIQHIKKPCWTCNGSGVFRGYNNGWNWVDRRPQVCNRCMGTGVYEEFWTVLEVWEFAGYRFHRPWYLTRDQQDPELCKFARGPLFDDGQIIEGYIRHEAHKCHAEACYLLALMFDRQLFRKTWGSTVHHGCHLRTPLTWTGTLVSLARSKIKDVRWQAETMLARRRRGFKADSEIPF